MLYALYSEDPVSAFENFLNPSRIIIKREGIFTQIVFSITRYSYIYIPDRQGEPRSCELRNSNNNSYCRVNFFSQFWYFEY